MASNNNIIMAVPTANTSVNYDLPQSESAQLSFGPQDIDGLKLDANGGLIISFVEGGNVTISNFKSFIDNGNTLSLSDGTQVDPKVLFNTLGGQNDNPFPSADTTKIGIPAENSMREISLESGKKYLFNFDLSQTQGADVKDGKMTVNFSNGGKIVIANYEEAMNGKNPPELSLASKTCVVSGDELITNLKALAATPVVDPTVVAAEEKEQAAKRKSKIAAADMDGKGDIGPGGETALGYKAHHHKGEGKEASNDDDAAKAAKVQPAAGDDTAKIAQQLANIDTAAGGPAGRPGNTGYGYRSNPGADPFTTNPDIGPIAPTNLGYQAPVLAPSLFLNTKDDSPIAIGPDAKYLDETNLVNGPISTTGAISINFGADGNGGINPNGTFTSGGSETGGVLSSNGSPITVTVVGNTYVGTTAGGEKVFDLTIDSATGAYKFTQYQQLDHANGSDPNDQIVLNFGIVARDGDGDAVTTGVQIVIADDAPTASGDHQEVDETNLGPISVSGELTLNYGQDGAGKVETDGSFVTSGSVKGGVLASSGVPVVVTSTATGYEGKANGVLVFTLVIDNQATGHFVYTQYKNLDHADNSNPDDVITLTFGAKVIDYDGDSVKAPIIIDIKDDGPDFQSCGCGSPKPDHGLETVDETNLKNGPLVETGKLDADFGADTPGSYAFKAGSFVSTGSKTAGNLTHDGVAVTVTLEDGKFVGKAGDTLIFTLELNHTTGDYKYTQYDNFDHADGTNPNDVITMDFTVIASDYEGDGAEGLIRINVKDDAPVANNDVNTYDTTTGIANGNVVSGLNGGTGAKDDLSTDGKNTVTKIAFGSHEVDVPATGSVSIDGAHGKLTIMADGTYTYKAFDTNPSGTTTEKEFTAGPALPSLNPSHSLSAAELQAAGIAPGNLAVANGDTISISFVSKASSYTNTLGIFSVTADGSLKAETIAIQDTNAGVAGQTFNYTATSDAITTGLFLLANGYGDNNGYAGVDLTTGKLNFVYDFGLATERDAKVTDNGNNISLVYTDKDGVETVLKGHTYFSTDRGGSNDLNIDGLPHVVSGLADPNDKTVLRVGFEDLNHAGDKDYNDVVIDISVVQKDCGCHPSEISDEFTYTLKDGDGDTDKATLLLTGKDLTDVSPIITAPAAETVDETSLSSGVITETGTVAVNFGVDGPGTIAGNGAFTSTGSKLGGNLTSGGVPVVVSMVGDTYTGKAGSITVFTLQIHNDGTYTFKLLDNLDHADGTNPNDIITLNFGVIATDCDGDTSKTNIVVNVKDDAPVANDDGKTLSEKETVTGNVTTNDVVGQDTPGTVTKVTFNGKDYSVPTTGNLSVTGDHGTLTINKDGVYSYTAKANSDGTDAFTYTLKDNDGDTDTAILSIQVNDIDTTPIIIKPADETVDETNLKDGTITETGTVTADFKDDGPGSFAGNGSFTSSGSRTNNALTSNGVPVTVTLNGNTYEGKAGGVPIFTMTIAADGSYTFKLLGHLDHANGNDPNDIINLDFGVKATDADGDSAATTITVKVKDDAPIANDDILEGGKGKVLTGNVTTNDVPGQDTPAKVIKIDFNGTSHDVPATGNLTLIAHNGTLVINQDGVYTYTMNKDASGVESFTYTLQDKDGDIDTAILSVCTCLTDDVPSIIKPADEIVDETNLATGVITETGAVSANFFDNGPGTFGINGSFASSGSRTNNALTSDGVAVTVTQSGNVYTGKAGDVTVFTMTIASNGSYTFKLYEQLDHANGSDANDIINLDFGVKATDADGDSASTTITVKVKDDAPVANDDGQSVAEHGVVTGNVTTNDVPGQDTPATVTKVAFGATVVDVPATGTVSIVGTYGTLVIDHNGAYTYTAKSNVDGTDAFTYTLKDFDGDIDTAILSVKVNDTDTTPQIIKPADEIVDETNLATGVITETGSVTANFFADGPGTFAANNNFASSGSRTGNALTSNGVPVTVALSGNTYTGKAGNETIFTMTIAADGSYTFKLLGHLDHADGTNPNDIINLDFGVKATDADGDSAATTITVKVKDDAPVANDDGKTIAENTVVTGNVTTNDVVGQDTPGTVTKVSFNGTDFTVPATGTVTIAGTYGTLVIDHNGAYTYTAKVNVDGTDNFTYTLKDKDGDTDPAVLSICVTDTDTTPQIIKPADEIVDETNLATGVITETGSVTANFFADGPGTFAANNNFASSGSRTGNALTSNGVPVTVALSGNTYTGKAGNETIFTMTINANGSYTFKLLGHLDHADGTNPNDIINLDFGVKATDADGDSAATTITVKVKDDAPVANDDGKTIAENTVVTGNVTTNDVVGQDTPGTVTKVSFNGTDFTVPATGTVTIAGTYGTLVIDHNGAYTYTAKVNVDGTDNFTYTLKDKDGDTDPAVLSICVTDTDTTPQIIKPADEIVDETNLATGVITETGSVTANFFADGPGTFAANNNFASSGSRTGNALTSNGVPVTVALSGNTYTGKAGNETIFTMTINANGSYTFKLLGHLDHADGTNPNDIINLDFGVKATDADGDSAATTITVKVKDDAPVANDDGKTIAENTVVTGNVTTNDVVGQDTPGTVTKVSFNGTDFTVPATGTVTIAGTYGTLVIDHNGAYTYTAKVNVDGTDNFTYTLKDKDGDTDPAVLSICVTDTDTTPQIIKPADEIVDETNLATGVITETGSVTANFFADGPGTFAANNNFASSGSRTGNALTSNGVPVTVALSGNTYTGKAGNETIFTMTINANGSYTFKLLGHLDHADGTNPNDIINLDFGVKATDADGDSAATTITVKVKDDAPVANDDGKTIAENTVVTGNVTTNDVVGQDTPGTVTKVSFNGTDFTVPATGTVTIAGTYGTLVIDHNGAYTYTAKVNVDGTDNFTYTLKDKDGDTDPAVLSICVTDTDTTPQIIKPADEIVDETNLATGVITETGSVTANFFADGPGTFAANNNFASSGSRTGNALTSNGVPVTVALSGNTYTGKAGNETIFTMTINANGSYTFKLLGHLDHADGTNPNDIINLDFGVKATDADGDSAATTITVKVKDDAPVANDDGKTIAENTVVTGNVTTNDVVGQDTPGTVTKVSFNGTDFTVPATGTVTIAGTYGTLVIDHNGAYTYTAKVNVDGTDNFTYTLKDKDGDTDPAVLSICVTDTDTTPQIIKPADEIVDETNLATGVITETGSVTANFFADGPGTFAANNNFASSGSRTGNALTSNGVPVTVALSGNTYTGKAGNETIFTMTINANGSYTFKLLGHLDHADGTNPNDIINLDFGVKATDADGDSAATTITVKVKDDAPVANDDGKTIAENTVVTGNVTTNDVVGQDTPGTVTKVSFNGTDFTVPATGTVTIAGTYGTLVIDHNGAYTYTAKVNVDGTDNFTYTLKDKDGDTDPAVLSICVTDTDTTPQIIKPADEIVDETNLATGVITETGSVTANFFADGPGTFAANNNFASSGSRTGNALTSNGVPVTVALSGNTYTGKAGNETIFTMTINANGSYTFKLLGHLDHADGTNPNDIINLDFGVKATDADGDSAATTITVKVKDDAPVANDDGKTVVSNASVNGNVTTNDVVGQDTPGTVTKVVFNGTTFTVPGTGTVSIAGTYGTLVIDHNGAYTYTAKNKTEGTDNFTYTLKDHDGDTDTAVLSLQVQDNNTVPTIIKPAIETVDETNLSSGTITETGKVTADFKSDGPGTFAATSSFTSSGSKLGGALTSHGVPVVVSLNGNTYEGKAGGITVFTMAVLADGSYTFKLLQQLDHADGTNPNDAITLDFGVKATDADGDSASTTISVKVLDDAPVAKDDFCTVIIAQKQFSSNMMTNDIIGQDSPAHISMVSYGGHDYTVPTSGTVSIATLHGLLMVAANGDYTFRVDDNWTSKVTDEFTVKLTDYDGDSSNALLQINIIGSDLSGTEGKDTIYGSSGDDTISGNGGDDWLYGQNGNDVIHGGDGNDRVEGGLGHDTLYGDAGNDLMAGREGNDTIYGGEGNDDIYGDGSATDTYSGNDTLYGQGGDDYMYGGKGDDYLDGGTGNDVLYGGDGNDTLIGGAGADDIIGEKGNDILYGGSGADTFWFLAVNEGVDRIKDFSIAEGDKLELSNVISNFHPATDAINNFVFATQSGADTIISVNNAGTGAGGATQLLVLENQHVTVSDLFNHGSLIT